MTAVYIFCAEEGLSYTHLPAQCAQRRLCQPAPHALLRRSRPRLHAHVNDTLSHQAQLDMASA